MKKIFSFKFRRYLFEILVVFAIFEVLLCIDYDFDVGLFPWPANAKIIFFWKECFFYFGARELIYELMRKNENVIWSIVVNILLCVAILCVYIVGWTTEKVYVIMATIPGLLIAIFLFISGAIAEVKELRRTKLRKEEISFQIRERDAERRNRTMEFFVRNDWKNDWNS